MNNHVQRNTASEVMAKFNLQYTVFAIIACAAISLLLLSIPVEMLDQDGMMYALVAEDLLEGVLPYGDTFDHKPFGIYLVYALFISVFGDSYLAIRMLTIVVFAGTSICIALALKKLGYRREAIFAGAVVCLAYPIGLEGLSGNTEIILMFFLSAMFLVSTRTKLDNPGFGPFVFGVLTSMGFSVNYLFSFLALTGFLAVLAQFLCHGRAKKLPFVISTCFLGFVVGSSAIYSPYIVDYLSGGEKFVQYISDQRSFLGAYSFDLNKQRILSKLLLWIAPFALVVLWGLQQIFNRNYKYPIYFPLLTYVGAAIAASASMSFFNHYWVLSTVSVALLTAACLNFGEGKQLRDLVALYVCMSLGIFIVTGSERVINHHLVAGEERDFHRAMQFIDDNISSSDRVVGIRVAPSYFFNADLRHDQKYIFPNHAERLHKAGLLDADEYHLNLLSTNPDFVFTLSGLCDSERSLRLEKTCDALSRGYQLVGEFQGWNPFDIYELNGYSGD